MRKKVENYLLSKIKEKGCIHLSLLDPDKIKIERAKEVARTIESIGSSAIMVGGSTCTGKFSFDDLIIELKSGSNLPIIIFPGNIASISKHADAIWFLSVLNSSNPYYITGAQALSAPIIKSCNLEAIPLGYIIISPGGAAGFVSQANVVPPDKPEIAAMYALAAQYMGMRFIYLERGSGSNEPVPVKMVEKVRSILDESHLIVGGGIKSKEQAREIARAGAEIIVTGTLLENENYEERMKNILEGIEEGVDERRS
ncbi:MAG: geranylgeranylglyceryl/heptaprenylglyceryl phosphate synthase [Candidatus Methanomethyliaceae archaeon]|nr:geranylgeranylglyceryl/heptaprenylglyceryl phosphate synthase [Candidatus Methanomethyliaceae archaeon]MDW7970235.1 geranylgeranylglyceryl/heptaprenylglyceryl phosphate synthase [Nitrososphaerota archaeon]